MRKANPPWPSREVADFTNAAQSAKEIPAAAPYQAALQAREPRGASTREAPTAVAQATMTIAHPPPPGIVVPPPWLPSPRKTPRPATVPRQPRAARHPSGRPNHTRRITTRKRSSVTRRGWTSVSPPFESAAAWNKKARDIESRPRNQIGRCRTWFTSLQLSEEPAGAVSTPIRSRMVASALHSAAARARTIATSPVLAPRGRRCRRERQDRREEHTGSGCELRLHGLVANVGTLHERERHEPALAVASDAREGADLLAGSDEAVSGPGEPAPGIGGPHEAQAPRHLGPPGVEPRDQLLARVAALRERDRPLDEDLAGLVGDRRLGELPAEAGHPRRDAGGLEALVLLGGPACFVADLNRRRDPGRAEAVVAGTGPLGREDPDRREGRLAPQLEASKPLMKLLAVAGLHVEQDGLMAEARDAAERLDLALGGEDEGEPGAALGEALQVLGDLALEPGERVGPIDEDAGAPKLADPRLVSHPPVQQRGRPRASVPRPPRPARPPPSPRTRHPRPPGRCRPRCRRRPARTPARPAARRGCGSRSPCRGCRRSRRSRSFPRTGRVWWARGCR